MLKIAVHSKSFEPHKTYFFETLFKELENRGAFITISKGIGTFLNEQGLLPPHATIFGDKSDLPSDINFMISAGGDGTMLDTITYIQ
jgi:NAD+ kinase